MDLDSDGEELFSIQPFEVQQPSSLLTPDEVSPARSRTYKAECQTLSSHSSSRAINTRQVSTDRCETRASLTC